MILDADCHISSHKFDGLAMTADELAYGYRLSRLKGASPLSAGFRPVVLDARFRLSGGDASALRARATEFLEHRRRTQPVEPSLGSTFMNPAGDHAGHLIEAAGLKGTQVGGVMVSPVHANFIVNPRGSGHATAADVIGLVELVRDRVKHTFDVELVPEIQLAGEW